MNHGHASGLAPGVRKREVWSWALYDFANSGYTTVVITALFSAYFVAEVAGNEPWATFAWTSALAVSYALIMFTAPLLGAWADRHAAKKRLLLLTTAGCVLFTAALSLVGRGDVAAAMVLIVLSNYFFGSGENLIAAFLPELARGEALGRVSGWGWGLGYLGGLAALGLCLAYVSHAQAAGAGAAEFVPVTMLITAGLFVLASTPTFVFLRERARPRPDVTAISLRALASAALRVLREFADLRRFLLCLLCYQAGIQTVIALAAIYAQQAMGFTLRDTLQLILVVNITAAIGALGFGHVQDRLGHVRSIGVVLAGWIVTVLLAWSADSAGLFWLAANCVGLCLGSSQSAGRALVGWFSPAGREAEFFGLWGLAVKCSSILGPLTYGAVSWLTGGDHRLAMLITGGYFVVGLLLLGGIDAGRGRRAAEQG